MFIKKLIAAVILFINISAHAESRKQELDQWRIKYNVPGVAVMISSPAGVQTLSSGITTIDGKGLVDATTVFPIGSITKTFVSALILKLDQDSKLSINDSLSKHLPQYSKWQNVTIKQLLNMTSGIANFSNDPAYKADLEKGFTKNWSSDELINLAYALPMDFEPGTRWQYTNTNYLLLAEIIKKTTEIPFSDVLTNQIIAPLALKNTFFSEVPYSPTILKLMAHGYYNHKDMISTNPSNLGAAGGGMLMSTQDLHKWVSQLFLKTDIISTNQIGKMLDGVNVPDNPIYPKNTSFGLGVLISKDPKLGDVVWYTGVTPGYTSTFVWLPKLQKIIVAQANVDRTGDKDFNVLFPNQELIQKLIN